MSIDYSKPPLTYDEQIALLQERGVVVSDEFSLRLNLQNFGFQVFSNYSNSLHVINPDFKSGDIGDLISFDVALKHTLFYYLNIFESRLRESWSYHLSHEHGIHAYKQESLYRNKVYFYQTISKLFQDIENSKDISIIDKIKKYNTETLPNYVVKDVLSFGQLSKHFNNFGIHKTSDLIASDFGLESEIFKSWIHHFVEIRNIIAHHQILWNKSLATRPRFPKNIPHYIAPAFAPHTKQIYNAITMLIHCMVQLNCPVELLTTHLFKNEIYLSQMGFPDDWKERPIWRYFTNNNIQIKETA